MAAPVDDRPMAEALLEAGVAQPSALAQGSHAREIQPRDATALLVPAELFRERGQEGARENWRQN